MTAFTKALYRRDPAAAEAFHRQSTFEQRQAHGRPGTLSLTPATVAQDGRDNSNQRKFDRYYAPVTGFGQRTPTGIVACAERCSHPGCAQGCTLQGRR